MNPYNVIINLFAALAITVIAQPLVMPVPQAEAADFLEDLFGGGQPEVTTFDQVRTACQQANPGRNADAMERAIRCTAARSNGFSAFQLNLIKYDLELVKQIKSGALQYADFQPYEAAWMSEYKQNYNEQRRLANAVENLPLQQAQWANTIAGINQSARGYSPRMFVTHY